MPWHPIAYVPLAQTCLHIHHLVVQGAKKQEKSLEAPAPRTAKQQLRIAVAVLGPMRALLELRGSSGCCARCMFVAALEVHLSNQGSWLRKLRLGFKQLVGSSSVLTCVFLSAISC